MFIFEYIIEFCLGNRSRPTTQSGGSSVIKESADSNSATIDDANDIERIDRLSKLKETKSFFLCCYFLNKIK